MTATWMAQAANAGQAIQLQVVATNFLEGPSQWQVPTFAVHQRHSDGRVPVTIPAAPSGLTATAASSSQINLSWTNNATNQTGFQIDQATNSGFTQGLTTVTVGANVTTYSATGLSRQHHVLLPRAGHQLVRRFGQHIHGKRHDQRPWRRRLPFPCPMAILLRMRPPTTLTANTGGG